MAATGNDFLAFLVVGLVAISSEVKTIYAIKKTDEQQYLVRKLTEERLLLHNEDMILIETAKQAFCKKCWNYLLFIPLLKRCQ